jgi:hypothetical protein
MVVLFTILRAPNLWGVGGGGGGPGEDI